MKQKKRSAPHPPPFQTLGNHNHYQAAGPHLPPPSDLSPSSIFPPTPLDLFTIILPLTPPDATKSPLYVKELWEDFDHFGPTTPKAKEKQDSKTTPGVVARAAGAPQAIALPRIGTWRTTTSNATTTTTTMAPPNITALLATTSPQYSSASSSSSTLNMDYVAKSRRRPRGSYRCRKCGGAKRAHDCPFACKQKSAGTQTALDITGGPHLHQQWLLLQQNAPKFA